MEISIFSVDKRIREHLGKGRRIYNISFGVFIIAVGLIPIIKNGFSILSYKSILNECFVLMGLLSITFGIIGKELYRIRHRLSMDNESLRIKKSFEWEVKISLNSISQVKFHSPRIEMELCDYIKTIDLSWLSNEEFEGLKTKLEEFCRMKKIDFE